MNKLTWQNIFEFQQKYFIERLKPYLSSLFWLKIDILKSSSYPPLYDDLYHSELIQVTLLLP